MTGSRDVRITPPGVVRAAFPSPRARAAPISPLGPGLVARRLRIAPAELVRLGALLAGYDHLVSIHDAPDGTPFLLTTAERAHELDDVLSGLRDRVHFATL